MKKSLLYLWTLLVLIVSFTIAGVGASPTSISVDPPDYTADEVGTIFQVNITVQDVADLAGYEFKLGYDTTVLAATNITYGGIFGSTYFPLINMINNTEGWLHYCDMEEFGEPAFEGDGVIATITFNATGPGSTVLDLYDTILGDDSVPPTPMPHETIDGDVTVIPEFPSSMVMPLFLVMTLIAVILGKLIWSRRGRGPSIAK